MTFAKFLDGFRDILDPDRRRPAKLSPEASKRREKVIEQKAETTAKMSESTRSILLGTLATCYALLIADDKLRFVFIQQRDEILVAAAIALIAIIIDSLQYVFAYINIQQALAHPEQGYPKNWSRSGRQACFYLKQILAYLSVLILIFCITQAIPYSR